MIRERTEDVQSVLARSKILVDTCFLMHPNCAAFISENESILESSKLLVPTRVTEEIEALIQRGTKGRQEAKIADAILKAAFKRKIAVQRGEESDSYSSTADQVILRVIHQHISRHNIVVLTQDQGLMADIFEIRTRQSFQLKNELNVIRLTKKNGHAHVVPEKFLNKVNKKSKFSGTKDFSQGKSRTKTESFQWNIKPFPTSNEIEGGLDRALAADQQITVGTELATNTGVKIHLTELLGKGGEGAVYATKSQSMVCKIYHEDKLTLASRRKIELMSTKQLPDDKISWPVAPIYDSANTFRGFLMPRASGKPLSHGLFIPALWKKQNPKWTRIDSTELAISILLKIKNLHSIGVLMGDINPSNILIDDNNETYFVDCDSYQVGGFPCPVGAVNFVAPEIQGKDFSRFLRTQEHELFAVATLLFMIMLPGKQPYSHQGGTNGAENIRKMHFPYPLGEKKAEQAPDGVWRLCWSHLSYPLKAAFYETFHSDHRNTERTSVSKWICLFNEYKSVLENKDATFMGPKPDYGFDLSILPQNYRYLRGKGNPIPSDNKSDLERVVEKLADKAHKSPTNRTRHKPIRNTKGVKRQPLYPNYTGSGKSSSSASNNATSQGNSSQTQGGCFVATAVYQDEAHPTVCGLRRFRDERLVKTPIGRGFIALYNKVGPYLAKFIEIMPIMRKVIKPILTLASRGIVDETK